GREHDLNFSFKGIDESTDPQVTHSPVFGALASISDECEFFAAPSPVEMNAKLVPVEDLPLGLPSGKCTSLEKRFALYRGLCADGAYDLDPSCGYAVSAADCALIVAKNGDSIIAAHAGRNSVIDMNRLKGEPGRTHESVVQAIMDRFLSLGLHPGATKVWVGFSISPGPHFEHSIFDERHPHNRRLVEFVSFTYGKECFADDGQGQTRGWLDNKELIRRQFNCEGVPERNIDLDRVCTYSDLSAGQHAWYSCKRSATQGEMQRRNLFAVVVNS
ncbi:MAG: hypothetical protein RIQ41_555, partial [Candidatus Parcubacteria bacterium]